MIICILCQTSDTRISLSFLKIKHIVICDEEALWFIKLGFLLTKLACDKPSEWYVCQLFLVSQSFIQLICFFVFFHANLPSASKLVGWGSWRACCPLDSKSERSQSLFESNTSKYVKALKYLTKIATFSAKSSHLRIVGTFFKYTTN